MTKLLETGRTEITSSCEGKELLLFSAYRASDRDDKSYGNGYW